MVNFEEEQSLEIEALQCIFIHEGEFSILKDTYPHQCLLSLKPYPEEDCENHVSIKVDITFPEEYPSVPFKYSFSQTQGLEEEKISQLHHIIDTTLENNLNSPAVFLVAEEIQNFLRENNAPPQSMYEQMLSRQGINNTVVKRNIEGEESEDSDNFSSDEEDHREEEFRGLEEKNLCAASDRITTEVFEEWKNKFNAEMLREGIWKRKIVDETKSTGRMIFESGDNALLTKADFEEDKIEFETEPSPGVFWGAENVFNEDGFEEEDLDFDELDFDEDSDFSEDE